MIYLLFGNDTVNSKKRLREIKDKYYARSGDILNLITLKGEVLNEEELSRTLLSVSFFSSVKFVIIENFFKHHGNSSLEERLIEILDNIDKDSVLIFYEEGEIKKSPLLKILDQPKKSQRFDIPEGPKLINWIKSQVSSLGSEIDQEAIQMLLLTNKGDLRALSNELIKLASYGNKITAESVKILGIDQNNESVFSFLDSLALGKSDVAIKQFESLLASGEAPHGIFGLILKSAESSLKIKELTQSGLNQAEISKRLSIHPYVVKKTSQNVSTSNLDVLLKTYLELVSFDTQIRSGDVNPEDVIYKIISGARVS